MSSITVLKSSEINTFDIVKLENKSVSFKVDDINDSGRDFILLYMYVLPKFMSHGIKVGMATCHTGETFWHGISQRIKVQQHELALQPDKYDKYGLEREVIYWGICLDAKNENFKDYNVHNEILSKCAGIAEKEQEWFTNVPQEDLIEAFTNCRKDNFVKEIYSPRKEQRECVDKLLSYFNEHPTGDKFLLNCKMRFGKSYTTYKYCEEANLNKILILTFVPAVESSWREDLLHIQKDYDYFTDRELKKDTFKLDDKTKPFVIFLSLQNYLGKDDDNQTKDKIKKLQKVKFDLVIFDEYHFGAWNQRTQETLEDFDKKYQDELKKLKNPNVLDKFSIKTDKTICLSGTPFKALARGEFIEDNTFTYSYFDEQRNKYPNSDNNDFSVVNDLYKHFPDMKILGYNMSQLFSELAPAMMSSEKILNKKYFSLNAFFATKRDENYSLEPEFIYEEQIKIWLDIIKGASIQGKNFPYSNPLLSNYIKHTLWLMPTVNSCIAMAKLLQEDSYFSRYQIINLSSGEVGSGADAYTYLMNEIKASENTGKLGSIAITVNKLTIGVTVKPWFSVFVLKDLSSPEQYFQAVFRVQTPLVEKGKIMKEKCFVYDFNIDRASALLLKYAKQYESEVKSTQYEKLKIAKLIVKYMPIFINGDMEHPISEQVFYQLAEFGDTSGIPLSRKITNLDMTTRFADDETISDMLNDKEVSDILKQVFAHAKFAKPKTITPPNPPKVGFDDKLRIQGIADGKKQGALDYENYIDFDDNEIQAEFEKNREALIKQKNPAKEGTNEYTYYANGFTKGYEAGVNAPVKKMQTGKADGIEFTKEIKNQLGAKITYTKETSGSIKNIINKHLNDINNIPEEYRNSALYKRWYKSSFSDACINTLKVKIPVEKGQTIEDASNVLRHLLTRLFEFLYISVYRETTFKEIFNNANPEIFLEAVGIKKEDFQLINKYGIFQEDVLNNYIHEFFINESLGERLDLGDDNIKKQYRNSFDWFGYGVGKELPLDSIIEENNEQPVKEVNTEVVYDNSNYEQVSMYDEAVEDISEENIEDEDISPRYYLAYGSNLNLDQMRRRCPNAVKIGCAAINDYRLMFKGSGSGNYLTIEQAKGYKVPVGVFEIQASDESALDRYEGFPNFYYKKDFEVMLDNGNIVNSFAYIMHEDRKLGAPTALYIQTVREGYQSFGFDELILEEAIKYSSPKEEKKEKTQVFKKVSVYGEEDTPLEKIKSILDDNPNGMKAAAIASQIGLTKREVNQILYANSKKLFSQNILTHIWKLKK